MCKYFILCKYLKGCTAVGARCTFLCYVCHCVSLCNCTVSCATNSSLQALSERLFYYIAVSLLPHNTLCELEAAVEAGRALSPILQWHKHPNDYFSREAQRLYFNSLRTYWQELIDLTRWGMWKSAEYTLLRLKATVLKNKETNKEPPHPGRFVLKWEQFVSQTFSSSLCWTQLSVCLTNVCSLHGYV